MRIDERDIIFSRMNYKRQSDIYKDYYSKNPDKKQIDDELREYPELCSENTPTYDPFLSPAIDANFMFLSNIKHLCDGQPFCEKKDVDKFEISSIIKKLAMHYGAVDCRITRIDKELYYSYRGRHADIYGDKVDDSMKNAIVFDVRMEQDFINTAPKASSCLEVTVGYVDAAVIGMQIAYYIRNLGYNARCHMDGNYLMPLVPLADKAGLGQVGRNGLLISKANGCFVRLGAVTTDLELEYDDAIDFGVQKFCNRCKICSKTCPGKTISASESADDWKIDDQKCYRVWRNVGTDCGICISACPISQGVDLDRIKNMSIQEIDDFIDQYKKENGIRKYNKNKPFSRP